MDSKAIFRVGIGFHMIRDSTMDPMFFWLTRNVDRSSDDAFQNNMLSGWSFSHKKILRALPGLLLRNAR